VGDGGFAGRTTRAPFRSTREQVHREARFLLRTSGTGGEARWFVLSDANVLAVLASHLPLLGLDHTHRLLSTLPWHHAFGLVLECLAALYAGASLVRCAVASDVVEQVRLARKWKLDWWCAVPAMVRQLAAEPEGPAVLAALRGGIVGGAALNTQTCASLKGTHLRIGYGQTEASPGIMLGAPGEFVPDMLGRPVGCSVRLSADGAIEFSGANACLGRWPLADAGTVRPTWWDTGDVGRLVGDTYFFTGRRDDLIRLDNGRTLSALTCERRLQERSPGVGEILIWSPDGQTLSLAFTGVEPKADVVKECLGPLAARLRIVARKPIAAWRFTRKGEVDRVALRRQFSQPLT
jgi:long-subunit acyl-CoA synthetase (AMP-forming)